MKTRTFTLLRLALAASLLVPAGGTTATAREQSVMPESALLNPSQVPQTGLHSSPLLTPTPSPASPTPPGPQATAQPTSQPNYIQPTSTPPLDLKRELDKPSAKASALAIPPNDDFDSATLITTFPFTDVLDTTGATVASDDPNMGCGAGVNSNRVWYRFAASSAGRIYANTFNSNYDTVLAASTGSRGALSPTACNDDTSSLQSQIQFGVQPGTTYYLEVANYGSPGGGQLQITVEFIPLPTIDVPLDIVLLQDETGSMEDDIGALQNLAPQIWDSLASISTAGFRMSVVGFRDYAQNYWGDYGDWVYRLIGDFTTSRDEFVADVNFLTASGGNDEPEAQYATLNYLLSTSSPCIDSDGNESCLDPWDTLAGKQPHFRSGARRVILLATDAPFHDPDDTLGYPGPNQESVLNALMANRAIVIGLVPGGVGYIQEVDELAALTGGSTQNTGSSGQDVANAIAAALGEVRPVSPDLSSIQVSPNSVPADGTTLVNVTVTLRDTANTPVVGKTVLIFSDRAGDDIASQPPAPTDAYGQTTGTISSITAGTSTISARDVTDNVQLTQQVSIEFTGLTIPPNEQLQRCIDLLDQLSRGELYRLNGMTTVAGEDADYFQGRIGADTAKGIYDSIWAFTDVIVPGVDQISTAAGWKLPGFLSPEWGAGRYLKEYHPDAGNFINLELWESLKSGGFHNFPPRAWNDGLMFYAAEL